jgi:S1-C subfamily serine protease
VGDQYLLTCFHVVAALSVQGPVINWALYPDLQVALTSGEIISATVVSVPTQADPSPLVQDFALVKLARKPLKNFAKVQLASEAEAPVVGDNVVFSGYPLATPGMVTHRGMVSGFDGSETLISIQASINKGNSGGALLDSQGRAVGIMTSSRGSVRIMGVDPLQSTKEIIQTLDQYISTGIGYARSIKFAREYLNTHQGLLNN